MTQPPTKPLLPRLLTKLAPPRFKSNRLRRNRLVEFLIENKDSRLTIISAPAGYGKTTLLADYVSRKIKPSCWLTFDASDADPTVFIENLVLSISRVYPQFSASGQLLPRLVEALHDPAIGPEVCSRLLINQIYSAIEEDFEIILDDHHMVENQPEINQLLSFLLNYLPDNCRILLSCRSFSPLNLTSLILQGEVAGLGTADLMMTTREVHELLVNNYQLPLTQQEVADLTQQTEGWIAGILLGSRKVLNHLTNNDFTNHEYLFNYLANKVLIHLPVALRHFLLDSSILEYIQADFCDQLLENQLTTQCLRDCEQHRLFLTQVEFTPNSPGASSVTTKYYRFHALFREFLLQQLKQTNLQRYHALHYRAAQLFREQGDPVQMMSHFLQTQDYEATTTALLSISEEQLKAGHSRSIESWLNALPVQKLKTEPDLLLLKARALSLNGDFTQAHAVLENLESSLFSATLQPFAVTQLWQAKVLFWSGKIFRAETRMSAAIQTLEKALEILELPSDDLAQLNLKAQIYLELGICLGINGQYHQALEILKQAYEIEEKGGSKENLAYIHKCLALTYNELGEDELGKKHLKTSLKFWQETNNLTGVVDVLVILVGVYLNHSEYAKAWDTLEQALEQSRKGSYLSGQAYSLSYQGQLYIENNQFGLALDCYERALQLAEQANEKRLFAVLCAYSAAALRAVGKLDQAASVLEKGLLSIEAPEADRSLLAEMLRLEQIGLVLDQNRLSEAEKSLNELSSHSAPKEFKRVLAIKTFLNARLLFAQNKHKPALEALIEALTLSTQAGSRPILKLEAMHSLSLLYFAQARLSHQQPLQTALANLLKALPACSNLPPPEPETNLLQMAGPTLLAPPHPVPPAPVEPEKNSDTPARPGPKPARAAEPEPAPKNKIQPGAVAPLRGAGAEKSPVLARPEDQPLIVYAMGASQVLLYGTVVSDWRTAKASELLFFLIDHQGKPVRKEVIIEALWSEVDDAGQADGLFRSTLHRLRKAISPDWIKRQGDSYSLSVNYWYDVEVIEQLIKQGNHLQPLLAQTSPAHKQQALEYYRAATERAHGATYLSGVYSDWCLERQANLNTLQIELLLKQAELELQLDQPEAALSTIAKCLVLDKCNDAAHLLRLRVYKSLGNPTLLTQSYQLYCQHLNEELGMKPSREAVSFYADSFTQLTSTVR